MSVAFESVAIVSEHEFGEHPVGCDGWPGACALCAGVAICTRCGLCEAQDDFPALCTGRDAHA